MSFNTIRPASEDDLGAILRLQRSIPSMPQWSEAAWAHMLSGDPSAGGTYLVSVAERGTAVVGYVVSCLVASQSELEALAVAADHRREGLGRALCRAWLAEAQTRCASLLLLEVRASNVAAITLYRALGFEHAGRRPRYYTDPPEDALLMNRRFL